MIRLVIPGRPVPKKRPRLGYNGRKAYIYTPEETKAYEELIRWLGRINVKQPITDLVEVQIKIYFKGKDEKPDLDNVIKSLLDGMNGIVLKDDRQVRRIVAEMFEDPNERAEIEVRTMREAMECG